MFYRIFAVALMGLALTPARADELAQLKQMFGYFGATCPSQGEWTRAAISQSEALISVIRAIDQDPDCKTVGGMMGQLDLLKNRVIHLAGMTDEREVVKLKTKQHDLLLQLAQATDETQRQTIQQMLTQTQIELSGFLGSVEGAKKYSGAADVRDGTATLVAGTNILLNQALANQSCLVKHPSILSGVASLAGSVAAATATSGLSLGLAAGVQLLDSVTEYIRKANLQKKVDKLSEPMAAAAYQCVLESISNQWCSAQDALGVIDLKAKALRGVRPDDQLWAGIRILDRDLPMFSAWMEKVQVGADPSNESEAGRQAKLFQREAALKSARAAGMGSISEARALFNNSGSDRQKWMVLRALIARLTAYTRGENPMGDVLDSSYAPYFLMGIEEKDRPKNPQTGEFIAFEIFDPFDSTSGFPGGGYKPDMVVIVQRYEQWLQLGQERLSNEMSSILQPDPMKVINDAVAIDVRQRSPARSLDELLRFLENHHPTGIPYESHQRLYEDTKRRLREIRDQIVLVTAPGSTEDPKTALSTIYQSADLQYGLTLLAGRMEWAVRVNLNELLEKQQGIDKAVSSQLMAADDVIKELSRFARSADLTVMTHDIRGAQLITEQSLGSFVDLFEKGIRETAEKFQKAGKTDPRYEEQRASLCLKLLASPKWPEKISRDLCKGAQLQSIFLDGPDSIRIETDTFDRPHAERACHYRNFFRANRIYQDRWDQNGRSPFFINMRHPRAHEILNR